VESWLPGIGTSGVGYDFSQQKSLKAVHAGNQERTTGKDSGTKPVFLMLCRSIWLPETNKPRVENMFSSKTLGITLLNTPQSPRTERGLIDLIFQAPLQKS
jgi:hypothetical protein